MKTLITLAQKIVPEPNLILNTELPDDEPVIFIANHEKNYGPSMMQLFFPVKYHPWVIHYMLEEGECKNYISDTFFEKRMNLMGWTSDLLGGLLEPILVRLMRSTQPIPVYRGDAVRSRDTFRKSLNVLKQEENILIFPEDPTSKHYSEHVKEFYSGFLYLAKLYYRKFQRELVFCPVSINPQNRTIAMGRTIRYNAQNDFQHESERIRQHLMQQITVLYDSSNKRPYNKNLNPQDSIRSYATR